MKPEFCWVCTVNAEYTEAKAPFEAPHTPVPKVHSDWCGPVRKTKAFMCRKAFKWRLVACALLRGSLQLCSQVAANSPRSTNGSPHRGGVKDVGDKVRAEVWLYGVFMFSKMEEREDGDSTAWQTSLSRTKDVPELLNEASRSFAGTSSRTWSLQMGFPVLRHLNLLSVTRLWWKSNKVCFFFFFEFKDSCCRYSVAKFSKLNLYYLVRLNLTARNRIWVKAGFNWWK